MLLLRSFPRYRHRVPWWSNCLTTPQIPCPPLPSGEPTRPDTRGGGLWNMTVCHNEDVNQRDSLYKAQTAYAFFIFDSHFVIIDSMKIELIWIQTGKMTVNRLVDSKTWWQYIITKDVDKRETELSQQTKFVKIDARFVRVDKSSSKDKMLVHKQPIHF